MNDAPHPDPARDGLEAESRTGDRENFPRVVERPIDPASVCALVQSASAGALVTFAGTVRDEHLGRRVRAIRYVAYDSMAAAEIHRIEDEIRARWPDVRVAIVHRSGHLELGETSVFLAVSAPHRAEAFDALRHGIDTLKERVPVWKREMYENGEEAWLEGS